MVAILNLLENMPDAGEMMRKKIPTIKFQTSLQDRKQSLPVSMPIESLSIGKKKKIFGSFSEERKKTVYALQREKSKTVE